MRSEPRLEYLIMEPLVSNKLSDIIATCKRFGVRRLDLFGSATGMGRHPFDPNRSDLDFLVQFDDVHGLPPDDQHFGLVDSLESLFGRSIDLVDDSAVRNPYFRKVLERTREPIYVG